MTPKIYFVTVNFFWWKEVYGHLPPARVLDSFRYFNLGETEKYDLDDVHSYSNGLLIILKMGWTVLCREQREQQYSMYCPIGDIALVANVQ